MTSPPDTAPIRPEERFDERKVATYLRRHLASMVGDHEIRFEQFPGGKANLTYLARAADVEVVLRRPPLGPTAPRSHDMGREFRVLSVLHRLYPKAPQAFLFCEDPDVMGKPFVVMERRIGHVIRDSWPPALERGGVSPETVAGNLVDALAELHRVDPGALGLEGLGRPDGFVERQVAGWSERWMAAREDDEPAMEELSARLAATVPKPQAAVLLHNDFKLDNTMVGADGGIIAVLDWDMATLGDPLVDLGTTLAYWGGPGSVIASDAVMLGDAMALSDVVARYGAATGFDVSGVDWYRALALFRIAVIVQQIYIRYRRGQTTDDRFAELGAMVGPLAEGAMEII